MSITFIQNLDSREGLALHGNLAAFNGAARSFAVLTVDQRKASFGGIQYKDMATLVERLNDDMGLADSEMTGFAGKHVLSVHFSADAQNEIATLKQDDFVVEISKFGLYMQQAVVNWGNRLNKDRADQHKPLIRLEPTGEQTFRLILPDLGAMLEFNRRQKLGFFQTEAESLRRMAEAHPAQKVA